MKFDDILLGIKERFDARKISGYQKGGKYAGHKYTKSGGGKVERKGKSEEENGGGGNTKLPYGLANGEGINTSGMRPKEVWEALAGKGYSAKDAYAALKEGKHGEELKEAAKKKNGSSGGIRKAVSKLDVGMMPPCFSDKKMTGTVKMYIDQINSKCNDEDVMQFLLLGNKGKQARSPMKIVKTTTDSACFTTYGIAGMYSKYELMIPGIPKGTPEDIVQSKVGTFIHEYTHYINTLARNGTNREFTADFAELQDAIAEEGNNPVGEKAKGFFDAFKVERNHLINEEKEKSRNVFDEVADKIFGEKKPNWIKSNGSIDQRYIYFFASYAEKEEAREFTNQCKKMRNKIAREYAAKRRAIRNGETHLQGLYDSVSSGHASAKGIVPYGHSLSYFKNDKGNAANELLADYVAMSVLRPDLIKVFESDYPKTAKALRNAMLSITKSIGG